MPQRVVTVRNPKSQQWFNGGTYVADGQIWHFGFLDFLRTAELEDFSPIFIGKTGKQIFANFVRKRHLWHMM